MRIEIDCKDRIGIAQEVLEILMEQQIDLRGIEVKKPNQIFVNIPDLTLNELQSIMPLIRMIEGVLDVKTTAFMPSERERQELDTIVRSFPEPLISIDINGNISMVNNEAVNFIDQQEQALQGQAVSNLLKGFNFTKWLEGEEVLGQTRRLTMSNKDVLADILPIHVTDISDDVVLAGAVVILKSADRLGQQLNAFKRFNSHQSGNLIATSKAMRKVMREIKKSSFMELPIMLVGEVATGKRELAQLCHLVSKHSDKPFVELDCSGLTLPEGESNTEFHEALSPLVSGGTLYLSNLHDLPITSQSALSALLRNKAIECQHGQVSPSDINFVCSSVVTPYELVNNGKLNEDLYKQLNGLSIEVPAIRDREADILALAELFLAKNKSKLANETLSFTENCKSEILSYPWPGNLAQLNSAIATAAASSEREYIEWEDFGLPIFDAETGFLNADMSKGLEHLVKVYEANLLRKLYPAHPSSRQLAKVVGMSHTSVANKLREYNINKKTVKT